MSISSDGGFSGEHRVEQPRSSQSLFRFRRDFFTRIALNSSVPACEAPLLSWLMQLRFGRKRLLDTLLAATWREAGVTQILTLNWPHFRVYGRFTTEFSE